MKNLINGLFITVLPALLFSEAQECTTLQKEKPIVKMQECAIPKVEWIGEQNAFCEWQGKSASASVDSGFITNVNYLYWQAKEGGLEYLQTIDISGAADSEILANAELFEPDSSWNSGFRVGLGYIFPQRSQWDVKLDWTWFYSKAKRFSVSSDPTLATAMLRPTWLPFLMGTGAYQGSVHWNVHYNILNVMLGREFFVGKWLSVHPQVGVTGGWINQRYIASYEGAYIPGSGPVIPTGDTKFLADWNYHAAGIRMGTDAQWYIVPQLSLVANGFFSILYGKHVLNETFRGAFPAAPSILIHERINLNESYFRLRPALETELGFRWQRFFNDGKRRILLGGYYGFTYWFDQNIMVNEFVILDTTTFNSFVTNLPTMGDLQLQGLRIEAEIDF